MRVAVLIGSFARGDHDAASDVDILLVNAFEDSIPASLRAQWGSRTVNCVRYDSDEFQRYFNEGSLFLHHAFTEGRPVAGDCTEWGTFARHFQTRRSFIAELNQIHEVTALLARTAIFGHKYLTPLVNAFSEIKNACIFSLAHRSIYQFNKTECMKRALAEVADYQEFVDLEAFYNYSVRSIDVQFPFSPTDEANCINVLHEVHRVVGELQRACN
jgi:hypothetical protein